VIVKVSLRNFSALYRVVEEVKAKIARLEMSDAARSVLTADIAQLGSIITKPAAHRNVAQEDAENALYAMCLCNASGKQQFHR
jgi:hypothetical protein